MGGVAGAVIGHQIGRGDENTVATVAGAALGAVLGHEVARQGGGYDRYSRERVVERCRTRHEVRYDERVVAYRVTYIYNGRQHVTRLPYDPGRRIRLDVDVHPRG